MTHLLSEVKELKTLDGKEIQKLRELIELSHDFVTKIGLEISSVVDKAKGY